MADPTAPFYASVCIGPGKSHLAYYNGTGLRPVCGSRHNEHSPGLGFFILSGDINCRRCRAKLDASPMLPVRRRSVGG